jgi:hypothetical protein
VASEATNQNSGDSCSHEATVYQDDHAKQLAQVQSRTFRTIPRIPGYFIIKKLGEGTYGEVYLAEAQNTRFRVAVKFLTHAVGQHWQVLQEEVKQLALLHDDPGIVQIQDANLESDPPYYIMRYAEGGSLTKKIEKGPLPVAEAIPIFRRMTEALAYVHAKGVRHCDLKPGNVLLDARGRPLIADFGQAHLANDASPALGTFFYMAPEQADLAVQMPDARWDVYGLGAVFFAMLTGGPPREDATLKEELGNTQLLSHRLERYRESIHRARKPVGHRHLPGMDNELTGILDRCLEVEPAKRYRDAGHVLEALERWELRRRQKPVLRFAMVALITLLGIMTGLAFWMLHKGIDKAEVALVNQLKESDGFTAHLVGTVIKEKLEDHLDLVRNGAKNAELREAVATRQTQKVQAILHEMKGETSASQEAHDSFYAYSVVDLDGKILATSRSDVKPIEEHYRWRDWFNGDGDKSGPEKDEPRAPVAATYVSQPFFSTVESVGVGIIISTPIWDKDNKQLGLLIGSIKLESFYKWLTSIDMKNGFPVVLNERGHFLRHPNETSRPKKGEPPQAWLDEKPYDTLLCERQPCFTTLVDPLDNNWHYMSYEPVDLSAFKLHKNPCWHVLIQHDKAKAHEPLRRIYLNTILFGLGAVGVIGVLIVLLWGRLPWFMNVMERAHA